MIGHILVVSLVNNYFMALKRSLNSNAPFTFLFTLHSLHSFHSLPAADKSRNSTTRPVSTLCWWHRSTTTAIPCVATRPRATMSPQPCNTKANGGWSALIRYVHCGSTCVVDVWYMCGTCVVDVLWYMWYFCVGGCTGWLLWLLACADQLDQRIKRHDIIAFEGIALTLKYILYCFVF